MILLELVTILTAILCNPVESINLHCDLSEDRYFREDYTYLFEEFLSKNYLCAFRPVQIGEEDSSGMNLTVEHKDGKTDRNVTLIIYSVASVPILPVDLYQKFPNLETCIFYNLNNFSIEQDWFQHSQNLREVDFFNFIFPVLEGEKFIHLKNLQKLNFKYNGLKEIDENAFVGLKSLTSLEINYNDLEYLPQNLFKELVTLEELYLRDLKIKTITPALLNPLAKLKLFIVYPSPLESIPDETFKNNLELTQIELEGKIQKMSNKIFSHLKNLQNLALKENTCVSQIMFEQNSSILFTEDILLPCSCNVIKKKTPETKLRKVKIYFGVIVGVAAVSFYIFVFQTERARRDEKSSINKFYVVKKGKTFSGYIR